MCLVSNAWRCIRAWHIYIRGRTMHQLQTLVQMHFAFADAVFCTAWIIWPTWTHGLQPRTVLSKNASTSFATTGMLQEGSSSSCTISVATERLVSFSRSNANSTFLHLPVQGQKNKNAASVHGTNGDMWIQRWYFDACNYHWGQESLVITWQGCYHSYLLPIQIHPFEALGWKTPSRYQQFHLVAKIQKWVWLQDPDPNLAGMLLVLAQD